jgi:hypothetical protein
MCLHSSTHETYHKNWTPYIVHIVEYGSSGIIHSMTYNTSWQCAHDKLITDIDACQVAMVEGDMDRITLEYVDEYDQLTTVKMVERFK